MAQSRVKYIETYPAQIERIFSSGEEYSTFLKQRFDEVTKQLDLFNPHSKFRYHNWKHSTIKLNKDGMPRKYNPASHLQTKKSRKKQQEKFKEYMERVKKEHEQRRLQKQKLDEETYVQAIKVLIENNIDLNRLDIRIKR